MYLHSASILEVFCLEYCKSQPSKIQASGIDIHFQETYQTSGYKPSAILSRDRLSHNRIC